MPISSDRTISATDPPAKPVTQSADSVETGAWYAGISSYQWLILAIACAGWVFDVYEGQIFNITRDQLLTDVLGDTTGGGNVKQYGDLFLGIFLLGGTIGGLAFGSIADRFGRRPAMIATILIYSIFSGLTYFAETLWQVAALRFLVAIGVGGEWAVAAALVSEIFPVRARAHASGIFHASSVLGTWMAALVGIAVANQWRYAYLVGIAPALLVLWVRSKVKEPEQWQSRQQQMGSSGMGRFADLLCHAEWRRRAILGTLLASVGIGTFWAVTVAGQNLAEEIQIRNGVEKSIAVRNGKFAYGIVETAGGGVGLLSFGPLCARWGRRRAFIAFQLLALIVVPMTCFLPQTYLQMLAMLPLFGFVTLGIHAGYAIYFPELFPTRIRATGASLCFNGGRLLAVPMLLFSGWLKGQPHFDIRWAVSGLSLLFLAGVVIAAIMPETRSQQLPE